MTERLMTVSELKDKLAAKEDFVFVDVREPHEYEEFNLGATLIPLGQVPDRVAEFGDKDKTVVIHCRSGKRSGQAQRYLQAQGYKDVYNVEGGVLAWREAFGNETAS